MKVSGTMKGNIWKLYVISFLGEIAPADSNDHRKNIDGMLPIVAKCQIKS